MRPFLYTVELSNFNQKLLLFILQDTFSLFVVCADFGDHSGEISIISLFADSAHTHVTCVVDIQVIV